MEFLNIKEGIFIIVQDFYNAFGTIIIFLVTLLFL